MRRFLLPFFLAAVTLPAQTPSPAFDAASVKINDSGSNGIGGTGMSRTGSFSRRNITLESLMCEAYWLASYQIRNLPAWAFTLRYDIEARPEHAVDPETGLAMLRNLLAERFRLEVHHEQAPVPGFHLTVDKGGNRLKPSEQKDIGFHFMMAGRIQGPGDMPMLARVLKNVLQAPVEDRTGLTGKYDVDLRWTSDELVTSSEPTVSVFAAIQEQLGLRLEAAKVTTDRLVVDRAERATEN